MEGLVYPVATEDMEGVGGTGDMVDTVEVEDQVGMGGITVATEGVIAGMEGIAGIMAGMVAIMVEAISTEAPAFTSGDTMGSPTIIPTGIILTAIITLPPITILINQIGR